MFHRARHTQYVPWVLAWTMVILVVQQGYGANPDSLLRTESFVSTHTAFPKHPPPRPRPHHAPPHEHELNVRTRNPDVFLSPSLTFLKRLLANPSPTPALPFEFNRVTQTDLGVVAVSITKNAIWRVSSPTGFLHVDNVDEEVQYTAIP